MFIKLKNLNVHYKVTGSGDPIILLPGWGRGIDCFIDLADYLAKRFTVYALDLPGFGLSSSPEEVWGSDKYAELVSDFIRQLEIDNPILLGHSFGGKVAINLVASNSTSVEKMILFGSSGIQLPKSLEVKIRIYFFKLLKLLAHLPVLNRAVSSRLEFYRKKFGSSDYKNADGVMRSILVKTVHENAVSLLPKIKVPTLLIWGEQDSATPIQAGQIMHKAITNSQLKTIAGSGHYSFLDNWEKVRMELDLFLT